MRLFGSYQDGWLDDGYNALFNEVVFNITGCLEVELVSWAMVITDMCKRLWSNSPALNLGIKCTIQIKLASPCLALPTVGQKLTNNALQTQKLVSEQSYETDERKDKRTSAETTDLRCLYRTENQASAPKIKALPCTFCELCTFTKLQRAMVLTNYKLCEFFSGYLL